MQAKNNQFRVYMEMNLSSVVKPNKVTTLLVSVEEGDKGWRMFF